MRLKLTEGIMLAAVPAVGYLSAYNFELGRCRAFGFSSGLIAIDLTDFLRMSLLIVLVAYLLVVAILALLVLRRVLKTWLRVLFYLAASTGLVFAGLHRLPFYWPYVIIMAGIVLIFAAADFARAPALGPARHSGTDGTFREGVRDAFASLKWDIAPLAREVVMALVALVFVIISQDVGAVTAAEQTRFSVIGNDAVVAVYGDRAILAPLGVPCSAEAGLFDRHFKVIDLSDGPISMDVRDLGDSAPCTDKLGPELVRILRSLF